MTFFFSCVSCQLTHILRRSTSTEAPGCPICRAELNRDVAVIFTARQLQRQHLAASLRSESVTVNHGAHLYAGSHP